MSQIIDADQFSWTAAASFFDSYYAGCTLSFSNSYFGPLVSSWH
jgi:hypothetical protein